MGYVLKPIRACLQLALIVTPLSSHAGTISFFGIGQHSCSYWLQNEAIERYGKEWVAGFWSGMNLLNQRNQQVGQSVDPAGKWGEIKKYCLEHPSSDLFDATEAVYLEMMKRDTGTNE